MYYLVGFNTQGICVGISVHNTKHSRRKNQRVTDAQTN